jgi:RHS repeat-associated protein
LERTSPDTTAYVIGSDVLAQAVGTNDPNYLLCDGQSSVRQLTDSEGEVLDVQPGQLSQSHYYDAYGNYIDWSDEPASNLRYTGQYFDTDAQQYYLRARWYNPSNGLFNRVDDYSGNYSDPQSLHKYLYCHAKPKNWVCFGFVWVKIGFELGLNWL